MTPPVTDTNGRVGLLRRARLERHRIVNRPRLLRPSMEHSSEAAGTLGKGLLSFTQPALQSSDKPRIDHEPLADLLLPHHGARQERHSTGVDTHLRPQEDPQFILLALPWPHSSKHHALRRLRRRNAFDVYPDGGHVDPLVGPGQQVYRSKAGRRLRHVVQSCHRYHHPVPPAADNLEAQAPKGKADWYHDSVFHRIVVSRPTNFPSRTTCGASSKTDSGTPGLASVPPAESTPFLF